MYISGSLSGVWCAAGGGGGGVEPAAGLPGHHLQPGTLRHTGRHHCKSLYNTPNVDFIHGL